MADITLLEKTIYDNEDASLKSSQTPSTEVGAWDMEKITQKINELLPVVNLYKQAVELSESNPSSLYGLQNGVFVELGQLGIKYLIRVADQNADYCIEIDGSDGDPFDIKTVDFTCVFKPTSFASSGYLFDVGVASSASEGNAYLRINTDGTLRVRSNGASNADLSFDDSTDALVLNQDNTISLIDGVLIINGVDQNIDMSAYVSITTVTQGVFFFALAGNGASNIIGDIKGLSYEGEILEIFKIGASLFTTPTTERGSATYISY